MPDTAQVQRTKAGKSSSCAGTSRSTRVVWATTLLACTCVSSLHRTRRGFGRTLMCGLEDRAQALGYLELHLDTATNQPEAVAFYRALGYVEIGRESRPDWAWTLVYFTKHLNPECGTSRLDPVGHDSS